MMWIIKEIEEKLTLDFALVILGVILLNFSFPVRFYISLMDFCLLVFSLTFKIIHINLFYLKSELDKNEGCEVNGNTK